MPAHRSTTPPDYDALIASLANQVAGPVSIETPQLGRVEYQRPAEAYAAWNLLRMMQAQAAGAATSGVFVVTYNDGLGCPHRSY